MAAHLSDTIVGAPPKSKKAGTESEQVRGQTNGTWSSYASSVPLPDTDADLAAAACLNPLSF